MVIYGRVEDLGCAVVWREELWLCVNGRLRMRSGKMRDWMI